MLRVLYWGLNTSDPIKVMFSVCPSSPSLLLSLCVCRVDSSSSSVAGPPPLTPVSSRRSSTRGAGDTAGPPGHLNPLAPNLPIQRRLAWEEETGAGGGTGEEREEEEDKEKKDERKDERKDEYAVVSFPLHFLLISAFTEWL